MEERGLSEMETEEAGVQVVFEGGHGWCHG